MSIPEPEGRVLWLALTVYEPPVGGNVAVVVFERIGETVMSVAIAYEVVVVSGGGVHSSFQRSFSGIADGTGRKSGMKIRVIGRVGAEIVVMQGAGVGASQQFGVNDAGIRLKSDVTRETVVVNTRNHRTLFGSSGFFFDNGCHSHSFLDVGGEPDLLRH